MRVRRVSSVQSRPSAIPRRRPRHRHSIENKTNKMKIVKIMKIEQGMVTARLRPSYIPLCDNSRAY